MNKVIFITGATKNTGLAIAEKFAENGYDVALTSRRTDDAQKTASYLSEKYGIQSVGYALDLQSVDSIKDVFAEVRHDFGRLDVFVGNSANLGVDVDILNATEEDFDSVIDVNLKGNFFCAQQSAMIMKENGGGSIVMIGSVHYSQAIWGRVLYTASKGGLVSLVKSLAVELGEFGIRANTIIAGAIHTERWDVQTPEQTAKRRAQYPAGRESFGEEIANGAFYLGTDLSATVTGTELTIDSGISICLLPYKKHYE
ncbi:MAG: SDR family oxidoreductase [Clostridia bacterium]|nr:SDR family oxidoreductase [Clostridia bacterium]